VGHQEERQSPSASADQSASARQTVIWEELQRDDFRNYLRYLGRHNLGRAAIQLRFSALRTFYKFLIRHGAVETSPIKNLTLPKLERRLPKFLTLQQMKDLSVNLRDLAETYKKAGDQASAETVLQIASNLGQRSSL